MLEKVWTIWITDILQPSLPHDMLLELGLTERPAMVARTLDLYAQQPELADQVQEPGTRLVDVFDRLDRALLIMGAPGAGKTTLLLTLARDLLIRAAQDPEHPIPVVFPLSSWAAQRRPLAAWLVDALHEQYDVPHKTGQAWVNTDQILPLLDGLDEVAPDHRAACIEVINEFRQDHGLLPLVVCSRVADYEALGTQLRLQGALVVQPLTPEQVESYLIQVGAPLAAVRQALYEDPTLWELLDTPLMLAIVSLTYAGEPVGAFRASGPPEARHRDLFAAYVDRMFRRRGASTRHTRQQTQRWLAWLACQLTQHSQTVFYLERMQPDWLPQRQRWVPTQGARLVAGLVGCVSVGLAVGLEEGLGVGLGVGLIGAVIGGLTGYSAEIKSIEMVQWSWSGFLSELLLPSGRRLGRGLTVGLMAMLGVGLTVGLEGGLSVGLGAGLALGLMAMLGVGLGAGLGAGLVLGLILGLGHGVAVGLVSLLDNELGMGLIFELILGQGRWLAVGLATGLSTELGIGLGFGLGAGLVLGLFYKLYAGLAAGFSSGEIATKAIPNEGIHRSARMAVISGLGSGLAGGLLFGLLGALLGGLLFGLICGLLGGLLGGLATGIRYGGRACLQHLLLRLVLRYDGSAPWQYADFLDYAAERIFLRKVGGGYSFIHGRLQNYFAARYTESGGGVHQKASV